MLRGARHCGCLEHGAERRGAHTACMRAVHLHDAQPEGVHGGPAARVARAAPPHLAAGGAPVEAEPVRSYFNGRLATLAQAVSELAREAWKRKRQAQRRWGLSLRRRRTCN